MQCALFLRGTPGSDPRSPAASGRRRGESRRSKNLGPSLIVGLEVSPCQMVCGEGYGPEWRAMLGWLGASLPGAQQCCVGTVLVPGKHTDHCMLLRPFWWQEGVSLPEVCLKDSFVPPTTVIFWLLRGENEMPCLELSSEKVPMARS